MAPKRRRDVPAFNSPHVTVGKNNIRRRKGGTRIADKDIRNNVLLYLENLKDEEANNYSQQAFQNKLASAVSGALDPVVGPEAYMDLSGHHKDLPVAFGNTAAGNLMGLLLGTLDLSDDERIAEIRKACEEARLEVEQKLEQEQQHRQKVEYTLGLLQELIPVDNKPGGGRTLVKELEALDQPVQDAAWIYTILWTSCLQWMDSRLRQLHLYGAHIQKKPPTEPSLFSSERLPVINARVHGGDLRTDALMCHIKFGDHRQDDFTYDGYIRDCFTNVYRLSIDDGLWLAKYGHDIRGGVDWPYVIGYIDKFVTMVDRVTTWTGGKSGGKRPPKLQDFLKDHFAPLSKHVSAIIKKAGQNPDWATWSVDPADLQTLTDLQDNLKTQCQTWKPTGQTQSLWDTIGLEQSPWSQAGYLRDVRTKQNRIVTNGAAAMKLRPQARVTYTA